MGGHQPLEGGFGPLPDLKLPSAIRESDEILCIIAQEIRALRYLGLELLGFGRELLEQLQDVRQGVSQMAEGAAAIVDAIPPKPPVSVDIVLPDGTVLASGQLPVDLREPAQPVSEAAEQSATEAAALPDAPSQAEPDPQLATSPAPEPDAADETGEEETTQHFPPTKAKGKPKPNPSPKRKPGRPPTKRS